MSRSSQIPPRIKAALELLALFSDSPFGEVKERERTPHEIRAQNAALDLLSNYLTGEMNLSDRPDNRIPRSSSGEK